MLVFVIAAALSSCVYPGSYNTSCTAIEIANSVTIIGNNLFKDNYTLLTTITFEKPSQAIEIGSYFCWQCNNLTSIEIPKSVTHIGDAFLYHCDVLNSLTFEKNSSLNVIGAGFANNCVSLTSFEIPVSVTSILSNFMSSNTGITSITFETGSQLEKIEEYFCNICSSLQFITIPKTVTSIEDLGTDILEVCFEYSSTTINFLKTEIWKTVVLTRPFGTFPISTTQSAYIVNPNSTNVTVGSIIYNDNPINVFEQNVTESDWWKTLCMGDTPPKDDDSSNEVAIIVGSVVGGSALIVSIVLGVIYL